MSTTAPVKSATNGDAGAAASSPAEPSLDDPAAVDHADAVAEQRGLLEVVRDEQRGHAGGVQHGGQLAPGRRARAGVERRQRLVEQQRRGLDGQRPRERHALALAAGQRARPRVGPVGRARSARAARRARSRRSRRGAAQAVGDVLPRAEVREQRVVLEHVAAAARAPAAGRRPRARVEPHALAARRRARAAAGRARRRSAARCSCRRRTARRARGTRPAATSSATSSESSPSPSQPRSAASQPSDELDRQQDRRGHRDEHGRQRQRAVEVGREALVDRQRRGLGDALEASRRTSAWRRTRRARARTRAPRRPRARARRSGSRRARTCAPREAPSVRDASSQLRSSARERRLRLPQVERRGDEGERHHDAGGLERELDAGVLERPPRIPTAPTRPAGDARHRGRQHQRQLDQRDRPARGRGSGAWRAGRRPACRPRR